MLKLFTKQENTKDELQHLESLVFKKTKEYEELVKSIENETAKLEKEFATNKSVKTTELSLILEAIEIKKAERARLELPLDERQKALDEREITLNELERTLRIREQTAFDKDFAASRMIEHVEDLADDLTDKHADADFKLKQAEQKAEVIKQRENDYMIKVDTQNQEFYLKGVELDNREASLKARESTIEDKLKDISAREKELQNTLRKITSERAKLIK